MCHEYNFLLALILYSIYYPLKAYKIGDVNRKVVKVVNVYVTRCRLGSYKLILQAKLESLPLRHKGINDL